MRQGTVTFLTKSGTKYEVDLQRMTIKGGRFLRKEILKKRTEIKVGHPFKAEIEAGLLITSPVKKILT